MGCVMTEPNDNQGTTLRWEEHIVPILEHPNIHIRDKALIAVQWELHARPYELHQLSFGDVEERGDYLAITLHHRDGGKRTLMLCGSIPYLKKWVQAGHPVAELLSGDGTPIKEADPEVPLWTQTHSIKGISRAMFRRIMRRACKYANVSTEFTLYDIRRSRAKLLANQLGLRNPVLRERFGWGPHKDKDFADTFEDEGLNEDLRPRPPIQCPNCGAWTPPEQPCLWCEAGN